MERELRRRKWIVRRKLEGWSNSKIAEHLRISERTAIRWFDAYKQHGWNGLAIKSRAPHTIHRIPDKIARKAIVLRRLNSWNEHAIAAVLGRRGIRISHSSVYRILKKAGLINSLARPRKQRTFIRFQRKRPNSLWQADLTLYGSRYVVAFLDDCSRFVTGMDFIPKASLSSVLSVLEEALETCGKPRQILTDHGTHFYSVRKGESEFDSFCLEHGIEHILAGIGKPTTLGKIERFFGTFKTEFIFFDSIERYLRYYNYKRLHSSLNYLTPAEVYFSKK